MDESEWIAFRNRRVASYSQYTIRDEPPRKSSSKFIRYSSSSSACASRTARQSPVCTTPFGCPPSCGCSKAGAWRSSADYAPRRAVARVLNLASGAIATVRSALPR